MSNKVVKFSSIRNVGIFDEEIPKLKNNEVLIAIKSVGICGSDIHYYLEGGLGTFKLNFPMEVGHEPSGIVAESKSKKFKKGDRVAIEPGRPCRKCRLCKSGRFNLCLNGTFMAANAHGAMAQFIGVYDDQLKKLPSGISFDQGTLLEPLGVALHAVKLCKPSKSYNSLILGSGPVGNCLMVALKEAGVKKLIWLTSFLTE